MSRWVFTNSYVTNWIVKIDPIPLQNYSSAALNTKYIWAIRWAFKYLCSMEISILVVVVRDLIFIILFLAAVKFHFHQLFPLRKGVSQEILKTLFLTNFSNYESFSTVRKKLLPPLFCIIIYPLFCIIIYSLKWQFWGKTYLLDFAQAVHSASTIFSLRSACPSPTNSFIQQLFPEHPVVFQMLGVQVSALEIN